MTHYCKTFIIHCMDFRLGVPMKNFLEKEGLLGHCDIISIAGGVKSLNTPKNTSDREFLLSQIDISATLHKVEQIILSNHTDCGVYGGSSKFSSFEKECNFHIQEMEKAKKLIASIYPYLKIRQVLGKITPAGEVSLEEIT